MKKVTFIDSCVLIAAARGQEEVARRAMEVLDDPERTFASSDFIRLEVLPNALYFRRIGEAQFYQAFFDAVAVWAVSTSLLVEKAYDEAKNWNLSAMDALHVAAAVSTGADELVTTEKTTKPINRVTSIPVWTIHPGEGK